MFRIATANLKHIVYYQSLVTKSKHFFSIIGKAFLSVQLAYKLLFPVFSFVLFIKHILLLVYLLLFCFVCVTELCICASIYSCLFCK